MEESGRLKEEYRLIIEDQIKKVWERRKDASTPSLQKYWSDVLYDLKEDLRTYIEGEAPKIIKKREFERWPFFNSDSWDDFISGFFEL